MQLGDQQASGNVEDRRGMGMAGGLGVGGVVIALLAYFLGFDPGTVIDAVQQENAPAETRVAAKGAPADVEGQFVSKVLGSTERVWTDIFQKSNAQYRPPVLVLYDGQVRSACGVAQSAMGPFYCQRDEKLYIDLAFFRELQTRFHSPGDFAQAYVIAHEVGHHVQQLTGKFQKIEAARDASTRADANRISVRLELQADCYAGVWGAHASALNQLDPGDLAEALAAANAIGDDRVQQQSRGRVVPEGFTHGTSEQRTRWLKRGIEAGDPKQCDTFGAGSL